MSYDIACTLLVAHAPSDAFSLQIRMQTPCYTVSTQIHWAYVPCFCDYKGRIWIPISSHTRHKLNDLYP